MARTHMVLLAMLIAGMLLVTNASAATLQGLEWGIAEGDQFNFDFTSEQDGDTTSEEIMYFECTDTPVIPNILDSWSELPVTDFDVSWANGTSLGFGALMFIFYFVGINHFAVPTGNYTLLTELYQDSIYNGTVVDKGGYWGIDLNDFLFITITVDIHIDFLKRDGMLAHWTASQENSTLSLVRQNLPSDLEIFFQENMLLVAGGAVVLLIVLAIVCRKK